MPARTGLISLRRICPEFSRVSQIDASPFDAGTAYVAIDRHQNDDLHPHLYKTSDYGKTWTTIVKGIPDTTFVRAVREDPKEARVALRRYGDGRVCLLR